MTLLLQIRDDDVGVLMTGMHDDMLMDLWDMFYLFTPARAVRTYHVPGDRPLDDAIITLEDLHGYPKAF